MHTLPENQNDSEIQESLNIAQTIMGTKDYPKYVRLNHSQFKKVMRDYIDTDLVENDDFQTVMAVVFEDGSELYHILTSPDDN